MNPLFEGPFRGHCSLTTKEPKGKDKHKNKKRS